MPAFQSPGATLSTSGLIVSGTAGDPTPQPQVFTLHNLGLRTARFTSIGSTTDGGDWFKQSPESGALAAGESTQITLQPNFSGLAPGIRKGLLNLTLGDGVIHSLSVLSIVSAPSAPCLPVASQVQITSPEPNFVATVGKSVPVSARITDNCNNLLNDPGKTFAFATLPDSQNLQLISQGGGLWTGTWSPSLQVDVASIAVSSGTIFPGSTLPVAARVAENGAVMMNASTPKLNPAKPASTPR